ncbi:asparagine synthase (glutamine-hydrolyzing) [Vibrio brasiliensis]|uniref:asparagine synthase (glutamine-hydrolyzing) n=1 Tax=Vibrio brasiliensis TaxID=170652 RepID=UPI001EFE23D8|nr:asparagine synthase (glutamine-hydrolyzing) [Vibrio brasiliensis]MCG9783371.1 asparagine synthase (glutamine-hydrolyzing) [Vibrio brasiliensis]
MCGIFGYFDQNSKSIDSNVLNEMASAIEHRGPDGQGLYEGEGFALGNQRLAILDIEHGNQPFVSDDENIIVVQNGEIFNHVEIAAELQGTEFECRTHSDTEVILRLYQRDGIDFIQQLNGMFAIAIYDKNNEKMFLIRDRVGEKPFYYSYQDSQLVFASEIKSILATGIERQINYDALDTYLTYNYVTPPLTLFSDIHHVLPGHYLEIDADQVKDVTWWDVSEVQVENKSESEWIEEFNTILSDAVRIRLRSDVPFGAFLSGGVDSSTVVGLMAEQIDEPVSTYTIGFKEKRFDESPYAQEAADRFNTRHTAKIVESNMFDMWAKSTYHCDQPHGDVSFMPTLKVAELAAEDVKVVLTGDGADELFAGYDKYRDFFSKESSLSSETDEFYSAYIRNISLFTDEKKALMYRKEAKQKVTQGLSKQIVEELLNRSKNMDRINQSLYIDTMLLLSGNNLVKPDKMGMAVSIENRAPFLDYRMIELAFSMPGELKLYKGETKSIYKKAVSKLIGEHLAYRKKQMFTVPIGEWLKSDLKPMVEDLLFSPQTRSKAIFNSDYIEQLYLEHCQGTSNYTREIRAIMALEIWLREFDVKL